MILRLRQIRFGFLEISHRLFSQEREPEPSRAFEPLNIRQLIVEVENLVKKP